MGLVTFFKILLIYLRERVSMSEGADGEGEADSPLSREPSAGLNLTTPRS